jgi:predicted phosphodiesterase
MSQVPHSVTTKLTSKLVDAARTAERESRFRTTIDRLNRQLVEEKARTRGFHLAIERAVQDAVGGLTIPAVPRYTHPRTKHSGEEKAVVLLSDLQLAKVTPTYNSQVAAERVALYAEKVSLLTSIQRSNHPVREVCVYLLGDIVEGELIFPHQPFQIDASLIRQVKDGGEIVANFVRRLLATFEKVKIVGVIGNHGFMVGGRGSRYNPESNMDRMLYLLAKEITRDEKRVEWVIPWERNESSWYAVDYPFPKLGFLLFHGHQIPGGANHSDGTIARHIYGWASGAVREPFTYAVYGHWHRPRSSRFNRFRFWCNGSVESTNTYAQEKLASVGFPEQQLLFVNNKRVTAEYLVDLG